MAIATFSSSILSEFGDTGANTIITSRDAAGRLLVNGGTVPVLGSTATVANTSLIQTFGQGGNDTIALDESDGALPAANLFGGAGNDTITGGSGEDLLFGQDGNDTLLGKGGNDQLFGGAGNDVLSGGAGDDQVFGQSGNDRMIWNPGDGSDLFEGGEGIDTAEVNGGNGAETFTVTPNGTRVLFQRVTPANLLIILVLIPFWTSILVRTYAWMVLLGRRGIINNFLVATGLIDQPLPLLNTRLAVCVAMVHVLLPFMVLPIYSTLKSLDWRLIRAAEGLGARPLAVFRQVLLPLSLPGISAGCILVFTLAIGFYITPALVGGPSDLMISILIANQVNILDWPQAAAMAVVLLVVVLVIFAGFTRVMGIEKIFQGQR